MAEDRGGKSIRNHFVEAAVTKQSSRNILANRWKREDILSRRNSASVKIEKYSGCSRNKKYSRIQK